MNKILHRPKRTIVEPLEILKNIPREFLGEIKPTENQDPQTTKPFKQEKIDAQKLKAAAQRRIQALEAEIEDMRKIRAEKDRQRLVSAPESPKPEKPSVEPFGKKSRRLMGWGAKVKQLKSQAETRLPPSG